MYNKHNPYTPKHTLNSGESGTISVYREISEYICCYNLRSLSGNYLANHVIFIQTSPDFKFTTIEDNFRSKVNDYINSVKRWTTLIL